MQPASLLLDFVEAAKKRNPNILGRCDDLEILIYASLADLETRTRLDLGELIANFGMKEAPLIVVAPPPPPTVVPEVSIEETQKAILDKSRCIREEEIRLSRMTESADDNEEDIMESVEKLKDLYNAMKQLQPDSGGEWSLKIKLLVISMHMRAMEKEEEKCFGIPRTVEDYEEVTIPAAKRLRHLYTEMKGLDPTDANIWSDKLQRVEKQLQDHRRYTWKPFFPEPILDLHALYFVNRETAVLKLVETLNHNHVRAITCNTGLNYKVPIIDQVFGMGKTEFGVHFGHECSKLLSTWRDSKGKPSVDIGFLESLSRVRSIALYPPESSLSKALEMSDGDRADACETVLKNALSRAVDNHSTISLELSDAFRKRFEDDKNINSTCLDQLIWLKRKTGDDPIMVIFDDFAAPFSSVSDVKHRKRLFMDFCELILLQWLRTKGIYFIIMGRGEIFEKVGLRGAGSPVFRDKASPVIFERLQLGMLRKENVKKSCKIR